MTRVRGRRLWMKIAAHGGVIPVYVTKDEASLTVDDCEVDAYYDPDGPYILIRSMDNISMMCQRLHHELLHVCFGAHSGDAREVVLGSKTPAGRAKREEMIVSFIEPVQFDLLVRNGFLHYPKPPRMT